jgi:hypothetical protein
MSQVPQNSTELKMLPGMGAAPPGGDAGALSPVVSSTAPNRQLSELPKDELELLAEEYGLDPHDYKTRQALVSAIHNRRQLIASMDREAMLDVIKWGRRPVTMNATKEQIAQEIARIRSMRFAGLSHRGLVVLARLRGINASEADGVPLLIRRLKRQEGLFAKLNRKRRAFLGSLVSNMIGEEPSGDERRLSVPPPHRRGWTHCRSHERCRAASAGIDQGGDRRVGPDRRDRSAGEKERGLLRQPKAR